MTFHQKFPALLLSSVFVLLTACGRDDVPAGNSSQSVVQDNSPPAADSPVPTASDAMPPSNDNPDELEQRVDESDIIPEEYTTDDASVARLGIVTLQPTQGNTTSGMVAFIQAEPESEQVRVVGKIINIAPGAHGFHLHDIGNCTTPDASSAGEHFNPTGALHASREAEVRHIGDLGNLVADADSTATIDFYDDQLELVGMNSVIGKAFIVHADEDDLTSQPAGNSGDRIACGVVVNRQPVGVPQ